MCGLELLVIRVWCINKNNFPAEYGLELLVWLLIRVWCINKNSFPIECVLELLGALFSYCCFPIVY